MSDLDAEANLFAECLLMPENLVRDELDSLLKARGTKVIDLFDENNTVIKELAKKFAVTEAVMFLRLNKLGLVNQ